jgi:small conductance mechanosensitive channel
MISLRVKDAFEQFEDWFTNLGLQAIAALVLLLIGLRLANILRTWVERLMSRSQIDATLVPFTGNLVYIGTLILTTIIALAQLGVQTASFITILGSAGLAIGLAVQGSLANFAAGILIIIFRPFKVGDYIEGVGVSGTVAAIQILSTTLKTPDHRTVIVPNRKLFEDSVTNFSTQPERRIDLTVVVAHQNDLDQLKQLIQSILLRDRRILKHPQPQIGVFKLADNGIHLAVRPWVKNSDYWAVYFDLQEALKKKFDAEGVGMPITL